MSNLATRAKCELWLHPAQKVDIQQDASEERKAMRQLLFEKYPTLDIPLGAYPKVATNDWVDQQLIEALECDAVNVLVTEDRGLTRKASVRVGNDRVLSLADAISVLAGMIDSSIEPPPVVEVVQAYGLDLTDPIWVTFRENYPNFDAWIKKCREEHRRAWIIRREDNNAYAGVAIVNHEEKEPRIGKTLKICSFKVDPAQGGRRYGELLLKTLFIYAEKNGYDSLFVTAFPEHTQLLQLFSDFGFALEPDLLSNGEVAMTKGIIRGIPGKPTDNPLAYHIESGPFTVDIRGADVCVVPIQPVYHQMLFPELEIAPPLIPGREAYGNAIRKAYICRSSVKGLAPGTVVLFYRSQDEQAITAIGVVEDTLRSNNPELISAFVLPRTVYTTDEIAQMCAQSDVLAIRFRQCLMAVAPAITLDELLANTILKGPPQSITKLKEDKVDWLTKRLEM